MSELGASSRLSARNTLAKDPATVCAPTALPAPDVYRAETASPAQPRVVAFPLRGIDYVDQLYQAASELGIPTLEGRWAGRWILRNIRRGDLAHLHWPSFLYFHAGKPAKTLWHLARFVALTSLMQLRGARIAWTAHNLYPHEGGRAKWVHRAARQFVARVTNTIFVHGPTAAQIVRREFGVASERISLIPHGHWRTQYPFPPPRDQARRRMRLTLPPNATLYGFIGSCLPYKNVESILGAFPQLDDSSQLLIAGAFRSSEYLQKVRSLIPAGAAAQRVHIVPKFLGADEIMTYVSGLDVLVLSYKEILTSGVVMLALSAGVPVVAPRIGGIPDVVNECCGVLYDPQDPEGLLKAMREIRHRRYSREQIIAYATTFDWTDAARALKNALERQV
jgi:beta-1,4-mannosyltransferase